MKLEVLVYMAQVLQTKIISVPPPHADTCCIIGAENSQQINMEASRGHHGSDQQLAGNDIHPSARLSFGQNNGIIFPGLQAPASLWRAVSNRILSTSKLAQLRLITPSLYVRSEAEEGPYMLVSKSGC